jgi:hypothetical protein
MGIREMGFGCNCGKETGGSSADDGDFQTAIGYWAARYD